MSGSEGLRPTLPLQAEQKGKDWFSRKEGIADENEGGQGVSSRSRKASTSGVSHGLGQHRVRETAMQSADVAQNNLAMPLPNCMTLGTPPALPSLL